MMIETPIINFIEWFLLSVQPYYVIATTQAEDFELIVI